MDKQLRISDLIECLERQAEDHGNIPIVGNDIFKSGCAGRIVETISGDSSVAPVRLSDIWVTVDGKGQKRLVIDF